MKYARNATQIGTMHIRQRNPYPPGILNTYSSLGILLLSIIAEMYTIAYDAIRSDTSSTMINPNGNMQNNRLNIPTDNTDM